MNEKIDMEAMVQELARTFLVPIELIEHTLERPGASFLHHNLEETYRLLAILLREIAHQYAFEKIQELRPGWQIESVQDATPQGRNLVSLPATYFFVVYSSGGTEVQRGIDMVSVSNRGEIKVQNVDALGPQEVGETLAQRGR